MEANVVPNDLSEAWTSFGLGFVLIMIIRMDVCSFLKKSIQNSPYCQLEKKQRANGQES